MPTGPNIKYLKSAEEVWRFIARYTTCIHVPHMANPVASFHAPDAQCSNVIGSSVIHTTVPIDPDPSQCTACASGTCRRFARTAVLERCCCPTYSQKNRPSNSVPFRILRTQSSLTSAATDWSLLPPASQCRCTTRTIHKRSPNALNPFPARRLNRGLNSRTPRPYLRKSHRSKNFSPANDGADIGVMDMNDTGTEGHIDIGGTEDTEDTGGDGGDGSGAEEDAEGDAAEAVDGIDIGGIAPGGRGGDRGRGRGIVCMKTTRMGNT